VKLGFVFRDLFCSQLDIEIFEKHINEEDKVVLRINKNFEEEIRKSLIISPQSLPMVVRPNI
jgi:hypothetical protein